MFIVLLNGKVFVILFFLCIFGFIIIGLLILLNILNINGIWLVVLSVEILILFLIVFCIFKYKNRYKYM